MRKNVSRVTVESTNLIVFANLDSTCNEMGCCEMYNVFCFSLNDYMLNIMYKGILVR